MIRRVALGFAGLAALVLAWVGYTAMRFLVYASPTEEIVFESGDIRLAGTLIKPARTGVFPGVVMLHGAGPDTGGEPGYRVSAKTLVRRGFTVLVYNKRGTGDSGGDFRAALYRDFIADGAAAVRYLAGRRDIDPDRIGLFGASESGWFTPEIAATTGGVAFIINKAGPPLSWIDTVLWEARNDFLADGVAEADLDTLLALTRRRWDYLSAAAADPALAAGPERDALEAEIGRVRATVAHADRVLAERLPDYDPETYRKFANYAYDPAPYLRQIDVPMLYIFAELDVNVPTAQSIAFLESVRDRHGKDITIEFLPGVGHSFYTWRGLLNAGYPPGYLDFIGSWAARQVAGGDPDA